MSKIFLTFLASLIFMTLSACSDHSHGNDSHSHDEPEHHETIE